ncbi:LysR family transcriptional regulator [Methylobacterium oryzihabitans]|uniref:LysR family transcriptional regulator n=1 Tax=Methylobacterium oryzihabitans TaxID=2499852 RepID=A0A437P9X2_9HYPH|nr:LysR family transcriptional regulator [Methylobacterium oryzihabitans]RVU19096.1 LysR family transcriptional regulator [Methylobacterium oryzihabitans]
MRARHIEVFRAVMRSGTLTRAAGLLNVSQPALSQSLLQAEDELGFKLFERVKGRLVPTPEAEELFPEAERLFGDLENLRRMAQDLRQGRRGLVRLATSAPPALSVVPAALDAFRRAHPEVRLLSSVVPVERIIAMLEGGQAGLGLAMTEEALPMIETKVIGRCDLVCLLPEGHRLAARPQLAVADLAGERLIAYRRDSQPGLMLERALARQGETLRPDIEVELSIIALAFVQGGLGVAIVDGLLPWRRFAGVTTVPLLPRIALPISLLTSTRRPLSRHHDLLRQELRRAVAAHLGAADAPP